MKRLTIPPEEHLRNEDARKAKARAKLSTNYEVRNQDFRRTLVHREDLDIVLPMFRREYEPINPLEFQWRKLLRLVGTWRRNAISGVRSVLRTLGTSFSRVEKNK